MLRFEATLAARHLRSGGSQTLLTVSAVAVGVVVVVFISSLIFGLRERITGILTEVLPEVVVSPAEEEPVPLSRTPGGGAGGEITTSRIERQSQQRQEITDWRYDVQVIRGIPEVRHVAPVVTGQGFLSKGERRLGVMVYGADPEQLDTVLPVSRYVFAGRFFPLGAQEIVISYKTADDLGVGVGDRVRLTSTESLSETFTVRGIYDTGQEQQVGSRACIALRTAQSLYGTVTAVRSILVKTDDLFHADRVADRIHALLSLKADSWSRQNPQVVSSLEAQKAVAYLVSAFSLAASGFAIASVLIVSVLQRSKQIGILKSMGAQRRQTWPCSCWKGWESRW